MNASKTNLKHIDILLFNLFVVVICIYIYISIFLYMHICLLFFVNRFRSKFGAFGLWADRLNFQHLKPRLTTLGSIQPLNPKP